MENRELEQMVETTDVWIRERTGICRRHIAEKETVVDMGVQAAMQALQHSGISAKEIDLLIVSTLSAETVMPSVSCRIQERIGAVRAVCFDLNAACTGFLFALNTAQAYIGQGLYQTALVIGAESLSHLTNWNDRSTCVLFGDGAGAVILRGSEDGKYAQITHSVGSKGNVLTLTSRNQPAYEENATATETYMQMDGKEVFKFAVSSVPEAIHQLLNKEDMDVGQISYYLLHQANARIVASVAKRLKEDIRKFPMNMEDRMKCISENI